MAGIRKHSVTLAGHRTSYSLEPAFHAALAAIAERRAMPLAALVALCDRQSKAQGNLSSRLRMLVLESALNGEIAAKDIIPPQA